MDSEKPSTQPAKWLGLPAIATIARLLCRELTLQNEYLRLENKILRSKIEGRMPFPEQFKNVADAEEQNTDGMCQHLGGIQCRQFLGGLLKSYMPTAA